ncbi:hypothetical protein WS63_22955 [Burkholderia stagnalis]|uniref:DUF2867 domain-containing protein n=1 Tax=Burkholderia stagnalis TaxID=1503054 RepID=A0ABX9YI58_9BURK|nr:hypothetical protein [Burkholderia stagnalis]AOK57179.1 hypothetical protein WT74_31725 [Burkholderia stagnalis]KVD85229.1 hypothetical protein WS63_22955 [Burkholderia stagnalis]KVL95061.1 hypothetical protein WT02_17580 [Burkholderia stagnalis]KVL98305.1 hypothetical protein WT03_08730 [Burkholderia stagnalis]KVM03854.1 hypothetical protein WT04_27055 [Burkholderia stagnalis]
MNALGIIPESSSRTAGNRPPFIPSFGFHECHQSRPIDAPPDRIIDTVASLDMRTDPIVNTLLTVREFPSAVIGALRNEAARREREPFGLDTFTLLQRDDRSLSLGLVGRFWRPDFDLRTIADADAFVRHADPRDAKLVLRFQVADCGHGAHALRTETFVHCPTARTRLLFMPYWLAIRLASGWIRRRTLTAVEAALA